MRQFFIIVIGGVIVIFLIVGGYRVAQEIFPDLFKNVQIDQFESNQTNEAQNLKTKVVYTAVEEEDLVNTIIEALPAGSNGKITAKAFLVKNLTTGVVVFEKSSDRLLPMASLTKLVTAVVARKHIHGDTLMDIKADAMKKYGNTAGFVVGEIFTADDLLYPLLMISSNDAAEAYAAKYGSRKNFIRLMNDFAQSIGAYRTYFRDPSGLSADNESTAVDLAIILDWIRRNDPYILDITTLKSKTIRRHTWVNPTHFLSWSYYMGGKNGFTDEADRTSASLFQLGGKLPSEQKNVYAIVLLGSENRDADAIQLIRKIEKAQ